MWQKHQVITDRVIDLHADHIGSDTRCRMIRTRWAGKGDHFSACCKVPDWRHDWDLAFRSQGFEVARNFNDEESIRLLSARFDELGHKA